MRVVLTGASGQLGAYTLERFVHGGHEVLAWSGQVDEERFGTRLRALDLMAHEAVEKALEEFDADIIVHLAALSSIEGARRDPDRAKRVNVDATAHLANWCAKRDRRIVYTSTDLVFDGSRPMSREDDRAAPLMVYGRTKHLAEAPVLSVPGGLVARMSLLFGHSRSGRVAFFDQMIKAFERSEPRVFFEDEFRTPLHLATAAEALFRLVEIGATGIVHVGGTERMSRFELARRVALALGYNSALVRGNLQSDATFPEPRPADVSLDTTRLRMLLPNFVRPSLEEMFAQRGPLISES